MKLDVIKTYYDNDIINDIITKWNEPHRHYHNLSHLENLLSMIENTFTEKVDGLKYESYVLAAFFHDVVYDPKSTRNEEDSVKYFQSVSEHILHKDLIETVSNLIMVTKSREIPFDEFNKKFWLFDNDILINSNLEQLIEYENKIFKEFQFVSYDIYKAKRISFLKNELYLNREIENLISYIKTRKIRVGVYSGSFNPFHKGHLNVFKKAEKIFDKVILSYGNNPEKESKTVYIPSYFNYYQVELFNGLVTDYISDLESISQDVTLIRGLRNGADLDYESNQLSFMKDFKSDIKVIYIPCDKEFEHISSSSIRNLFKFNEELAKKYIVI
ncbi:MAG: adenylyltransferase/cytidyltransferase family protein [bacterium]